MSWQVASFIVLALVIAAGFAWYERTRPSAKVLALVAAMAALAVVGRLAFAPFPNVKPTTDIVLLAGFALGGAPGFCVGAVAALVSNFFFAQGPWTPWQMAAWGGVGVAGALLARAVRGRRLGRVPLAAACGLAALGFGAVMDVYQWTLGPEQTLDAYVLVAGRSLPFNVAHVVASVGFCLLIGPPLVGALARYRRRLEVRWPAGETTAAAPLALLAAVLVAVAAIALPQTASAGTGEALDYLERAQNRDGGFGGSPRDSSNQLHTGAAALGLAAGGRNPLDVSSGGRSAIDFIRGGAGSLRETGDLARTILVVEASGASARSFAGRNLVGELASRERRSGSYDGLVNQTANAIVALRGAGAGGLAKSTRWMAEQQNGDGGFGFNAGQSSPDVTGQVLQALAAGGRRGSTAVSGALGYLGRAQRRDGGFGQYLGTASNVQSTAFVAQGLAAVGKNPEAFREGGRSPLDYIRRLQAANGSIRYARGNGQTPVWVTAQAIPALERQAFPLRAVARDRRPGGDGGTPGRSTPSGAAPAGASGAAVGGEAAPAAPGPSASTGAPGGAAAPERSGDREAKRARGSGAGAPRSGSGRSPTVAFEDTTQDPELSPDDGAAPTSDGGSVVGGLIAAASSGALVLGLRRRINGGQPSG